jgi:ribonuclease PH
MSAEGSSFSEAEMLSLLALAKAGCANLVAAQKEALGQ